MPRAYNFNPGPAALPDAVVFQAQSEFSEYANWQTSVMEISHRHPHYMALRDQTEQRLRDTLAIPADYAVLFLAGGAAGQTAAVPLNLAATPNAPAAYIVSGHWSARAAQEAQKYCRVHIAASSAPNHAALPAAPFAIPPRAAYLHLAENETVHGTEYPAPPAAAVPIVADLTSNIASRPIAIADYGLIYASAQKNLGIAGLAIVIVRRDLIRPQPRTPLVWNYQKQDQAQSMANTPPTYNIYLLDLMLRWVQKQGGLPAMDAAARARAKLIYDHLDASTFYRPHVQNPAHRSRLNIPFFLPTETLADQFADQAQARGLLGARGHKALGGIRLSLYNSMPLAGAAAMLDFMQEFENRHA